LHPDERIATKRAPATDALEVIPDDELRPDEPPPAGPKADDETEDDDWPE
jgi:predicted kinase